MNKPSFILLDTHVWIWWVSGLLDELSKKAIDAIDSATKNKTIHLSSISAWEVALLVERQRLTLNMDVEDWISKTEALPFVQIIPVNNAIAVRSVRLPGNFHKDPADRIIVATALRLGLPLVTRDDAIQSYPYIKTIW